MLLFEEVLFEVLLLVSVAFYNILKTLYHFPSSVGTQFDEIVRFLANAQASLTFCAEDNGVLKIAFRETVKLPLSGCSQFKLVPFTLAT